MKMQNCQRQPDYKFYPSLLDAYNWYASSENDESENDLINKINRVPFESEAASKGTWFNNFIDQALIGIDKYVTNHLTGYAAEIAQMLKGSAKQVFCKTQIEVDGKLVEIYGYIDYVKEDRVIDLKTTSEYQLGKYKGSLQLHFYPVALIDEGNDIRSFDFIVTDFKTTYIESYQVNYEVSRKAIVDACKNLIRFIETKRSLITDKKIFGIDHATIIHGEKINGKDVLIAQ